MQNYLIAFLLFISSINLYAQSDDDKKLTPNQRADKMVGEIYQRTYLSTDRKDSLTEIFVSYYQNLQAYKSSNNEKLAKAIEQTKETKIKNLLNSDQYEAYKQLMAEERDKRAKLEEKKKTPGMMNNNPTSGNRSANKW